MIAVNIPYYWVSRFMLHHVALHGDHALIIFLHSRKSWSWANEQQRKGNRNGNNPPGGFRNIS